ncbi:MAG: hypothetical protein KY475_23395 [Planctomycetes bacterium]|nr:hypothetical protein [Planctomycetota bacterium]
MLSDYSEIHLFHQFLGERLQNYSPGVTPEEAVEDFRSYQAELERCRREIEPALERSLRGETRPFDVEQFEARVIQRLAEKGIVD